MGRSYIFQITPKQITEMAQKVHNEMDENGDFNILGVEEVLADELSEKLTEWIKDNIDWSEIASNDLEAADEQREYNKVQRNGHKN